MKEKWCSLLTLHIIICFHLKRPGYAPLLLMKGTHQGAPGFDPDGKQIQIFLDCVGFMTDLEESTDSLYNLDCTAVAGSNLCSFYRCSRNAVNMCMYAQNTAFHSVHSSFSQSAVRHASLRSHSLSSNYKKYLGLQNSESPQPLQIFHSSLRN